MINNAVIAGAIVRCNQQYAIAASAFTMISTTPDNLPALDAKYRLAKSVKPEDPLSMMPEQERKEYLLLVAMQSSLAAVRGLIGVVNALVRERSGSTDGEALAAAIAAAISTAAGTPDPAGVGGDLQVRAEQSRARSDGGEQKP